MGFIRGVFAGFAVAVGAAAWYMSRAGAKFRDRYRIDRRLGELGDEVEMRTRDVRAKATAQMNAARDRVAGMSDDGMGMQLDDARAAAAEEAAEMAADVEAKAARVKRAAKSAEAAAEAEGDAGPEG